MAQTEKRPRLRADSPHQDEAALRYRLRQVEIVLRRHYRQACETLVDARRGGATPIIEAERMKQNAAEGLCALNYQHDDFAALRP